MNPLEGVDERAEEKSLEAKPTMQDLWRRHPEIQNGTMIEAPGIPYLRVVYVFCGFKVTQQEFDAVLDAFNHLTGCHYTQDDIASAQIFPPPTASSELE